MQSFISKSKFVSACTRCNKYAWLDTYKPDQKALVSEFTESLFDNGYKVGELAKEYLCVDADMTVKRDDGTPNLAEMLRETEKHIKLGTKSIAEASFRYDSCFCSVDVLIRNDDGSYDLFEVKSSKQAQPTKKNPLGVPEKHLLDASYQRYVLGNCGIRINRVYIVMLSPNYARGKILDLGSYFVKIDVTAETVARQDQVIDKIAELKNVVADENEPAVVINSNCNGCNYFGYCGKHIPSPSPFDVYNLKFVDKCRYYNDGVSFFDLPKAGAKLKEAAKLQIEYYNRPDDLYIDKPAVQSFLDKLQFPLYSLDFETYLAVIPEHEGMPTSEQIPFQYSLHIMKRADGDYSEGSPDLEEHHFLDISGGDPRRAIAESLVQNIPYNAPVIAYNSSTESSIVGRLAKQFPDLADHLLSFTYYDPLYVFQKGYYYVSKMGGSMSLKSVAPALYPDDPGMDYHNLEGDIRNGMQAMNAIGKSKSMSAEEVEKLYRDLIAYCSLDTMAVVKILKNFYDVLR